MPRWRYSTVLQKLSGVSYFFSSIIGAVGRQTSSGGRQWNDERSNFVHLHDEDRPHQIVSVISSQFLVPVATAESDMCAQAQVSRRMRSVCRTNEWATTAVDGHRDCRRLKPAASKIISIAARDSLGCRVCILRASHGMPNAHFRLVLSSSRVRPPPPGVQIFFHSCRASLLVIVFENHVDAAKSTPTFFFWTTWSTALRTSLRPLNTTKLYIPFPLSKQSSVIM